MYPKAQSVLIVELSQQASKKYISDFTRKKLYVMNIVLKGTDEEFDVNFT